MSIEMTKFSRENNEDFFRVQLKYPRGSKFKRLASHKIYVTENR